MATKNGKTERSATYVRTGRVMLSYPKLFVAFAGEDGGTPKYSTCIIISKKEKKTIAAIEDAIEAAKQAGKNTTFGGKIPRPCKVPLRDGDEEKDTDEHPEFKGCYFLNCSTTRRPSVVDADLEEIERRDDVYGGNIARVSLNFYAFDMGKNKGIAAGLNNVQILEGGEPLGAGSTSAADDFGDDEDEEPKPKKKKRVVVEEDGDDLY